MQCPHKRSLLTIEEEVALARRIHNPDDPADALAARNELVLANFGLVGKAVSWYQARLGRLDHDDLFSEGLIGLIRAAELYEPWTSRAKFSSYAGQAIFHSIRSFIETDAPVRVPKYLTDPNQVKALWAKRRSSLRWQKTLAHAAEARRKCVSLSQPEDDDPEIVPLDRGQSPLDLAIRGEQVALLPEALARLAPLKAHVLAHRFGLGPDAPATLKTYKQLGAELGLTRERVRQIKAEAIRELRRILDHPHRACA